MKFLFQNNIIIIHIGRITMMLKVFLHHLVGNIARAPYSISNGPKVTAPVLLGKLREFLLKTARRPSLEAFHQVTHLLRGMVLDMYVHMVLAYDTHKHPYIFRITVLLDKITASGLDIALENLVSIFGDPYYVGGHPRYRVVRPSLIISHITNIEKCVATESLALKWIVLNNDCDQ